MSRPDALYHRLLSHPLMVEQLVREFVPEAMAAGLTFERMEKVAAKFHAFAPRSHSCADDDRTESQRHAPQPWRLHAVDHVGFSRRYSMQPVVSRRPR